MNQEAIFPPTLATALIGFPTKPPTTLDFLIEKKSSGLLHIARTSSPSECWFAVPLFLLCMWVCGVRIVRYGMGEIRLRRRVRFCGDEGLKECSGNISGDER